MSKAAHNGCQARADIPTGLGMHQESTFAMSRLRHKRAVSRQEDSPNSSICLGVEFLAVAAPSHDGACCFASKSAALGCKLNSFQFYGASKVTKSPVRAMIYQIFWWDLCWHTFLVGSVRIFTEKLLLLV